MKVCQRAGGGNRLRVVETDGWGTAVILSGGCALPDPIWEPVLTALPPRRMIALSRAGLGSPWPGELPRLTSEAQTLIDLAGAQTSPVILVAHSMAGPHAEAAVRMAPELFAGLVLLDVSVEWRVPHSRSDAGWLFAARAAHAVAGVGPLRRGGAAIVRTVGACGSKAGRLSRAADDELAGLLAAPDGVAMTVAEFGSYDRQLDDLYAVRSEHPWPRVPTEILVARRGSGRSWLAAQERLGRLLDATVRVVDSGHLIMVEAPGAVLESLHRLSQP